MGGWARHVRTWAVARAVVRCAAPDGYAAMRHLFSRVDVGVSEGGKSSVCPSPRTSCSVQRLVAPRVWQSRVSRCLAVSPGHVAATSGPLNHDGRICTHRPDSSRSLLQPNRGRQQKTAKVSRSSRDLGKTGSRQGHAMTPCVRHDSQRAYRETAQLIVLEVAFSDPGGTSGRGEPTKTYLIHLRPVICQGQAGSTVRQTRLLAP